MTRRRFVQVCVAGATVAAAGSTLPALLVQPSVDLGPAPPEARESMAVCPVCSVGCNVLAASAGGDLAPARGDPLAPSTGGMTCVRGSFATGRDWPSTLDTPMRRVISQRGVPAVRAHFEPISWDDAIATVASRLIEAGQAYGPNARCCIVDGGVPLEDCYMASKVWKGVMGSGAIDCVESLHSRAAEAAQLEQLGAIGPPTCFADVGLADLIVVMGEDLASTHPVLYARVVEAVVSRGAKLVVVDPRVTPTATRARSVHVPCRAGAEVALLNGLGYLLAHELGATSDAWAAEHVVNAAAYKEYLKLYNPEYLESEAVDPGYLADLCDGDTSWIAPMGNRTVTGNLASFDVATLTGVDPAQFGQLASMWASARNVLTIVSSRLCGLGDGGAVASTVLNLHLLTGQIGRPGAGPLFLPATAAGRGAYDAGATPLCLPGGEVPVPGAPHAGLLDAWGDVLAGEASQARGASAMEALAAAAEGKAALLLLGGTVSASLPDRAGLVESALSNSFVAATVAHLEDPDAAWADVLLPRVPWPQRESHLLTAERRVERSLPCMDAPAGPRTELHVLAALGAVMTARPDFEGVSSTSAMVELARATTGTAADTTALPVGQALTDARGVQWPVSTAAQAVLKGTSRRHLGQDGRGAGFPTPTGKALVVPREHLPLADAPTPERPYVAVISVDGDTWWDTTQYELSGADVVRDRRLADPYAVLAREDAAELGVAEGSMVIVSTGRGAVQMPARIAPGSTARGHVFLPWGARAEVGALPPSAPLDRNGVPPWTAFAARVEPAV